MAETTRVHLLAKELNVPSKVIIDKCKAEGIENVKNHMSTLSAGLKATILEWFSEGRHENVVETAERIDLKRLRRGKKTVHEADGDDTGVAVEVAEEPADIEVAPDQEIHEEITERPSVTVSELAVSAPPPIAAPKHSTAGPPPVVEVPSPVIAEPAQRVAPPAETKPKGTKVTEVTPVRVPEVKPVPAPAPPPVIAPAGPQNVPAAAKLQGPRVVRYEAPSRDVRPPPRRPSGPGQPPLPGRIPEGPGRSRQRHYESASPLGEEATSPKRKGAPASRKAGGRVAEAGDQLLEWRDRDLAERKERLAGATGRRIHRRRVTTPGSSQSAPAGPKTKATVHEPVRMKEFCGETGINFLQLFKILRDEHGIAGNVNMILPTDTAQLLALHFGIELEVVPMQSLLDELEHEFAKRERHALAPRPPVVAMLGHVDHGKTSLLDAIRETTVAAGEDGGITQHIGAYHIQTAHGPVTLLDTPGHQAFTAMRARGAQLTDVVVLVVAANDGIMPQTVEAIHHAQAAKVPVVVALNKIDLGDQNKLKIYGQLSEHGLSPSEWGGEVDVIPTSATTGEGITELVEHLADLSSLLELKADPTLPARGTTIDAEMKLGAGPVARVLVQEGTLKVGDIVVCGNAYGKIRALHNDRGAKLSAAGPGVPAEVWGLDDIPSAGDRFYVVESTPRAKEIAARTKQIRVETGRTLTRKAKSLEEMFKRRDREEVPELNIIIKADVDGSLAALKHALAELPSDEVRLTIRHAAVGAVNDSDVLLAAACDGIIVAFRMDASSGAKKLAEQHGVEIRPYRVIYDVCDEIRKALSGMLTPEERIESKATVNVRQVFRVSKVGLVAGCYVTQGTVERNHLAKVIRDGAVVREGGRISSLRHLKDDVREVRAGMECGIRLEGFEDVHEGDVIETYVVEKIARTL
ncbi:MAG: translation initiation factor IF-2 [Planctomycetes bacterium]|nr:translation initiation factor IF-2 [Planctomycetota bacterium]MBI3835891.1 translation initiation factor IF-2 [Planctomycetota bacterium]